MRKRKWAGMIPHTFVNSLVTQSLTARTEGLVRLRRFETVVGHG